MPPAAVRRPFTVAAWIVMSSVCLALAPLLILLAAIVSALIRRPQPLILARLMVTYFARELVVLVACGALWLASGAGLLMRSRPFQMLHYRLLGWLVHGLAQRALEVLGIEVVLEPSSDAARRFQADEPLLFFSRHAGPGDTLLLIDLLVTRFERLPSLVFKESLTIDPCVDLIGHRLPHAVVDTSDRQESEARIEAVARDLVDRGVLVLFPEGGNFTAERRDRATRKLWRTGRRREAASAEQMSHVLPPRPTGALAALRGDPGADVIFGVHTGLGLAAFGRDLWSQLPIGRTLKTRMWLTSAAERPREPEAQVEWLYDWWKHLDAWVEDQGEEAG